MNGADDFLDRARQYSAVVVPDSAGGFVARAVDFPGAVGGGATRDEAADELIRGIAAMLEHAAADGFPAPAPMRAYSGALSIRLPRSLHLALAERAAAEGQSVNATVAYLLTQALGLGGAVHPPRERKSRQPTAT